MHGTPIDQSLRTNMEKLDQLFTDCADVLHRDAVLRGGQKVRVYYLDTVTDNDLIQRDVLSKLPSIKLSELAEAQTENPLPVANYSIVDDIETAMSDILKQNTLLLADGLAFAISLSLSKPEHRAIAEPEIEKTIKGAHDGFIESLNINLSLIRRRFKTNNLKIKKYIVGERSKQDLALVYIDEIANPDIIKRMEDRLKSIDYDIITGIGYLEQLTTDHPFNIFPVYQVTERPDRVAANLAEGRVAVLLEGTPVAIVAPANFFQFFQAVDDYTTAWAFGSFLRLLRIFAIVIAIFLPGLYIAVLTFHYEAVPLTMLVPLLQSRAKVPFTPIIEALIMELSFELLREASTRLPATLGPTVGIVGGLVIGQTAVQAGIVSNIMVVIVGITAIATFVVPTYDIGLLLRLSRFGAMILSAIFGIAGLAIYACIGVSYALSLESLGQPYLQPVMPFRFSEMKDTFIRAPFKYLSRRPVITRPRDSTRGSGNNRAK